MVGMHGAGISCIGHGGMLGISYLGVQEQMVSLEAGSQLAPLEVEGKYAPAPSEVDQGDQTSGLLVGWSGELVW